MRRTERLEWVARKCEGKDVLDVGCVGHIVARSDIPHLHDAIRARARSVLGIDIDREAIEKMRELGYNVICADAERFDASPHKFDVIVSGENIEHLSNPGLFFQHAWKNLRDDGQLIVTTPNACYFGVVIREAACPEHLHIYTPKLLSHTLKRHGFNVTEIQFFRFPRGFLLNLVSIFYGEIFLHFFPKFAYQFGVVAEKVER